MKKDGKTFFKSEKMLKEMKKVTKKLKELKNVKTS